MRRRVIAFACAAAMGFGLVGCGGGSSDAPAATDAGEQTVEAAADDYGYASASFQNWTIELGEPRVAWSEDDKSDVLLLDMRATNAGDEPRVFADINNFEVLIGDSDDYLGTAYGTSELNVSAQDEECAPGDSIEMTWAYALKGNYGDFRLALRSYTDSPDETEIPITGIEPTTDYTAFAEAAEAELAAAQDADEAQISGATVAKPEGWYFDDPKASSVTVKEDGGSATVKVSFATTDETPAERAQKYAGNYGGAEVQTATVNGVEWSFFRPADTQFKAYAQAEGGVVEASGMSVSWEDAATVMEAITLS